MSELDDDDDDKGEPVVNFRHILPGINANLYRSSAPESVVNKIGINCTNIVVLTPAEEFILNDVTLILDLRSNDEGYDHLKKKLIQDAPGGTFEVFHNNNIPTRFDSHKRYMIQVDLLGDKSEILHFIDQNWLQPNELQGLNDKEILMKRRNSLNQQGLVGLNQILLERKQSIQQILQLITQYLEQNPNGKILIHCTAGKDRTGMVCMLLQIVTGFFSDEDIITQYIISDVEAKHITVNAMKRHSNPLVDPEIMSGANREGIQGALTYLRSKYGSVEQYLDNIGFDSTWRDRLYKVVVVS